MKLKFNYSITIFYILLVTLIIACSSDNDFQYKGEYPKCGYLNLYNAAEVGDFRAVDTNMVSYQNRIYVTIDSFSNVFLNGHLVSDYSFERHFKFVYTNPKKIEHLPESTERAVIFFAVNHSSSRLIENPNPSMLIEKTQLKRNAIKIKMSSVVQALQEEYATKKFGISLKEATRPQQAIIIKKYPLNIAEGCLDKKMAIKNTFQDNEKRELKKRNVIEVLVKKDEAYLRGKLFPIENLTDTIKVMIVNDLNNPKYPEKLTRAIVSLKNTRGANYDFYKKVYGAIKKVYTDLWEEKSQSIFSKPFNTLTSQEQRQIKNEIPMILSEAEPTSF